MPLSYNIRLQGALTAAHFDCRWARVLLADLWAFCSPSPCH